MTKFNVIQKKRRAQIAERKRHIHGDPLTGKLKLKQQPVSISGKRKRKLLKKWRRDQKEAIQNGLVSMEDVQMAIAQGTSQDSTKASTKFPMKKSAKLKIKQSKRRGNLILKSKVQKKTTSTPALEAPLDSMVE